MSKSISQINIEDCFVLGEYINNKLNKNLPYLNKIFVGFVLIYFMNHNCE